MTRCWESWRHRSRNPDPFKIQKPPLLPPLPPHPTRSYTCWDGLAEINTLILVFRRVLGMERPFLKFLYWATFFPLRMVLYPIVLFWIWKELQVGLGIWYSKTLCKGGETERGGREAGAGARCWRGVCAGGVCRGGRGGGSAGVLLRHPSCWLRLALSEFQH